jgi:hypothetical protein
VGVVLGGGGRGGADRRNSAPGVDVLRLVRGDGIGGAVLGGGGAWRFFRAEVPLAQESVGDGGGFGTRDIFGVTSLLVSSSSSSKSLPNGLSETRGGFGGPTSGVPLALTAMLFGDIGEVLKEIKNK